MDGSSSLGVGLRYKKKYISRKTKIENYFFNKIACNILVNSNSLTFFQGPNFLSPVGVSIFVEQLSLLEGVSVEGPEVQKAVALLGTVLASKLGINIRNEDEL